MKSLHRILVGIDMRHPTARLQIAGILRFSATHPEWDVQIMGGHPSDESLNDDPAWRPDGLILDEHHFQRAGKKLMKDRSVRAAVFMGFRPKQRFRFPTHTIVTDERGIGVAAANLFCRHGLQHFAFVGSRRDDSWSISRMRFFKAALKEAGHTLDVYRPPTTQASDRTGLSTWLKALPRPCGLFVAFDQRAKYVIDLCRDTGISVPQRLQVLSVDNDEIICENTRPTLSSVAPDFSAHGYIACQTLMQLFGRSHLTGKKTIIPLLGIIERASTTDLTSSVARVERARDFIRTHATRGISVTAIVNSVGGSRRLLEIQFKKVIGRSLHDEIDRVRLDRAKEILEQTHRSHDEIAAACGFKNTNHLRNIFKAKVGTSLSGWRLRAQSSQPRGPGT